VTGRSLGIDIDHIDPAFVPLNSFDGEGISAARDVWRVPEMASAPHEALIQRAARAICAQTNVARPGEAEVIFDNPDDLMWDYSKTPPRPLPRWCLYEDRARAALEAIHVDEVSQALQAILRQVKRGQSAPIIIERSLHDIEELARRALGRLE
jgi:hypothetical protein